jgi:hypothetical protein
MAVELVVMVLQLVSLANGKVGAVRVVTPLPVEEAGKDQQQLLMARTVAAVAAIHMQAVV